MHNPTKKKSNTRHIRRHKLIRGLVVLLALGCLGGISVVAGVIGAYYYVQPGLPEAETIRDIPVGRVASYGQVADIAGIPRGARQVGYALRSLPDGHDVPWHRVLQASGRIAFEKDSRGYREQRQRLLEEDVAVIAGRVDMQRLGHHGQRPAEGGRIEQQVHAVRDPWQPAGNEMVSLS